MVDDHHVQLHVFVPSERKIWTVVGGRGEYWIDPNLRYCSCPGYFFSDGRCYHLEAVRLAIEIDEKEVLIHDDHTYEKFVSGLLDDVWHGRQR